MILQLLGVLGLSALSSTNAFSISNDSDNVNGGYTHTYISGNFSDFYELNSYRFIGFDLDINNETGTILYDDQFQNINQFRNFEGASDNPALLAYILNEDDEYGNWSRYDLFCYTSCFFQPLSGVYYYHFNWYYGDYFKLDRVITTCSFKYTLNNQQQYLDPKTVFGFPYSSIEKDYLANGDEGYIFNSSYYCDSFSPFSLANGGSSGNVDNGFGWRNIYPVNYGYSWQTQGLYNYTEFSFKHSYQKAIANDYYSGYNDGLRDGYEGGDRSGYQRGFSDGIDFAENQNSTALTIFSGIINIALIPINFFLACLNFEVFGINIGGFVSALLTIAIVIILIRTIFGGGKTE